MRQHKLNFAMLLALGLLILTVLLAGAPSQAATSSTRNAMPESVGGLSEDDGDGTPVPPPRTRPETSASTSGVLMDPLALPVENQEGEPTVPITSSVLSGGRAPSVVIGTDDRVRETETTEAPWRMIADLAIHFPGSNGEAGCTGAFIKPNAVLTAGHCLFDHENNLGWADEVEVMPGRDSTSLPFGSQTSSMFHVHPRWEHARDYSYDYGLIILPDSSLGNQVGTFSLRSLSDAELSRRIVAVAGYPGDQLDNNCYSCQLWWDADPVAGVSTHRIGYEVDTYKGQSGAPVWYFSDGWQLAGVHSGSNANRDMNRGTRIIPEVEQTIETWWTDTLRAPSLLWPPNNTQTDSLELTFDWGNSPLAERYVIQVSDSPQFSSNTILAVSEASSFYTSGSEFAPETTYYWRVYAMSDSWNDSAFSEVWQFTTPLTATPTATSTATATDTPPPPTATSTPPPEGQVKLWSLANFDGAVVWDGDTGFSNEPNAESYSLEIPSGWSARTWRGDNRGGDARCWSSSVANLQDHGWHLSIQSIEVFDYNVCPDTSGDDVVLCTSDDAQSGCWVFPDPGVYHLPDHGLNDQIRSIRTVPDNMSVMLFRESGLQGTAECYNGPRAPLPEGDPWDLRGQVTDVHVFSAEDCPSSQASSVVLYNFTNFGSHHWGAGYETGVVNMDQLPGPRSYFNDTAESVTIPYGWSIRAYEHNDRGGDASGCLTGDVSDLEGLKNRLSSIEIFHNTNCTPPRPVAPDNLRVTTNAQDSITLAWDDNASNETGFRVYRWDYDGDEWRFIQIGTVGANVTSYTDSNRNCGATYHYRVRAYNSGGESGAAEVEASTASCPEPGPLVYGQYVAYDSGVNGSQGNGDHFPDCGEILSLFVLLVNNGDIPAEDVVGTISMDDPYVTLLFNNQSSYGDISNTAMNDDDFDIALSANTPDGHRVAIEVTSTASNGGTWSESFELPVFCSTGPKVELLTAPAYSGTLAFDGGIGFSNTPNSNAESMFIPVDWSVRAWRGDNRSGESWCWNESAPYLSNYGWENAIESLEVFDTDVCPEIRFYDGTNYGGVYAYANNAGHYTLANNFNDRVESVFLPDGWSARLYQDDDLAGPSLCLTDSDPDLSDNQYTDGSPVSNTVSSASIYENETCPLGLPSSPDNLRVESVTHDSATIAWADSANVEDGYRVYRWSNDGSSWDWVLMDSLAADTTSYTETGLAPSSIYYYIVSSYNSGGESFAANWVQANTEQFVLDETLHLPLVVR